jgi:hypothetical protein
MAEQDVKRQDQFLIGAQLDFGLETCIDMTSINRHSKPNANRLGSILTIVIAIAVNRWSLAKTRANYPQKSLSVRFWL